MDDGAALVAKEQFIGGDERAYLLTAGEGLAPRSVLDATRRSFEDKAGGTAGRRAQEAVERDCRAGLAALRGAEPDEIGLLGSSSEGVNAVYALVGWSPGDNVVIPVDDLEFPSVVLPALRRERDGVEVRRVPHEGWDIAPEEIAALVDARTRLVFLSHVSYRTGTRIDLERAAALIRQRNPEALVAADVTQSLGVVPVPARACDFLVATACKWLLGPHGVGVFFWNRQRRPDAEPAGIGWYSVVDDLHFPYDLKPDAARFELGGPNMLGISALNEGVRLLNEVGVDRIERHVLSLGGRLLDQLAPLGLPLMTPADPGRRAGIVAWEDPDCAATARRLAGQGIAVSGSAGRIRAAVHLYTSAAEVDRLGRAMRDAGRTPPPAPPL